MRSLCLWKAGPSDVFLYGETRQLQVLLVVVETFLFKMWKKKKKGHLNEIIIIKRPISSLFSFRRVFLLNHKQLEICTQQRQ